MPRSPDIIFERQAGGSFLPRYRCAMMPVAKAPASQPLELLALEDRVLFSGAPLADLDSAPATPISDLPPLEQQLEAVSELLAAWQTPLLFPPTDSLSSDSPPNTTSSQTSADGTILIVVDRGIEGFELLLDDIQRQLPERYELLLIDSAADGWLQLQRHLATQQDIGQIHLFSHGSAGQLVLGNRSVGINDLFQEDVSEIWERALKPNADILLYACDLAAGDVGRDFMTAFASFTGADIAASLDQTGSLADADWELEQAYGAIETKSLLSGSTSLLWQGTLDAQFLTLTGNQDLSGLDRGVSQSVAINSDGSFVAAWASDHLGNWDIWAGRFHADGSSNGSFFRVNTTTSGDQQYAAIDMDDAGNFVVTWSSPTNSPGGTDIFARKFNQAGTALSSEVVVNTTTASGQLNSSISMAGDGRFVVVWEGNGSEDSQGIYARYFDANFTAIGSQIWVNSDSSGSQENAVVSMNDSGDFVVAWNDETSFQYQRFDSSGVKQGAAKVVSSLGTARQGDILLNHDGSVVSTWQEFNGSQWDVFWQQDAADGGSLTSKTPIRNNTLTDQLAPSVGGSGNGEFVIAWEAGEFSDSWGIFFQLYNASGPATPYTYLANNNYTANVQSNASVAVNSLEHFVVIWSGDAPGLTADDIGFHVYQNRFPTPQDDSGQATEAGGVANSTPGSAATGNVLANDTDPDPGDTLALLGVAAGSGGLPYGGIGSSVAGSYGSLTLNADGSYTYAINNSLAAVQALRTNTDTLTETFTYTVEDPMGMTSTAILRITIQGRNDAPVAVADTATAREAGGISNGTSGINPSGNVLANDTDVDSGDTKTVSGVEAGNLSSATGNVGTAVAGSYGSLSLAADGSYTYVLDNAHPDVQALRTSSQTLTDVFTYTIRDTDGQSSTTQLTVTIQGANDNPELGSLSPVNVNENTANGTVITTVTAVDVDAGDSLTYTLSDSAAGRFAINAATGQVTVANSSLLDYESATAHAVTIRVTDAAGSFVEQVLTINLTDVNEFTVSSISDSNTTTPNQIAENAASGQLVGLTAFAVDADGTNNGVTYSLDNDAGGRFSINTATGVVTTLNGAPLDYEAASSHQIVVRASSQDGSSSTQSFTINLIDVDEFDVGAVTDANTVVNNVAENSTNGTLVGITASATDSDGTTNTISYSLDNDAGGRFAVNSSTGVISVANGSLLDYETATSHTITVRATSADGSSNTESFTITLTDVDEFDVGAVTDSNAAANNVAENAANGTTIGVTAAAADADATNNTITYSLDDDAGGRFAVNSSTGVISVANGSLLDYETANSHTITVRATSADGSSSTESFTITLTDVDEFDVSTVSDTNSAANSLAENSANGTLVGITASATDADGTNNTITYSLDNSASGRFAINATTGVVSVADGSLLDYETATSYTITVRATSADGSSSTESFTITLTDVDEFDVSAVSDTNPAANSLAENSANGTLVGITASATDADGTNNTITYSLDNSASGRFAINATTGVITVADGSLLDYETATSHTITVRATSADGSSSTESFTITLTDVDEFDVSAISDTNPAANSLTENSADGSLVGITASATDADGTNNTITYSLDNSASGRFAIHATTGVVSVADGSLLNYEAATSHTIIVRATSADGSSSTESFTIILTDVDEFDVTAVSDTNPAANSLAENSANGSLVGITASATDADATNNTISYTLDDDAGGRFAVNSSTGVISVADGSLLNYEAANSHTITVRATSADGSSSTESFTITLTDVDEFDVSAISDTNPAANSLAENSANGSLVGITASATDADGTTNTITYSLDDDAGGRLAVNSSTGVISVANGSLLDYEAATSHTIIVRATSADASSSTESFTITLTDVDEFDVGAVTDSNPAANSVAENAANGTLVGVTASAADADATNNAITYSLDDDAGGRFAVNSSTGVISVADGSLLDYETATSHTIIVRATSADGSSSTESFTINLSDVDEFDVGAISDTNPAANSLAENSANGTLVGITASATDADGTNNTVTYSLDSSASGRFAINATTGVVSVADGSLLDYETATSHTIIVRATSADGSSSTESFTIILTDVDEFDVTAVSDTNPAANSLAENSANGTLVGITASATDADATNNTISYTLDDDAGGRFAVNSSTGVISVADGSLLNYEAATSHTITVRATSADGSSNTESFTITLTDVDEFDVSAVSDPNPAANSLAENSANGTLVGITASATDADGTNNTITYSLDNSASGRFAINATTGVITVADGSLLDYETATSHTITVRATSADGSSSTENFTINLVNANELPAAVDDQAVAIEAGGASNGEPGSNPSGNVLTNDTDLDLTDSQIVVGVQLGTHASTNGMVGATVAGNYGFLIIQSNGEYTYTINNADPAVESLRHSNETLEETFSYTMQDGGGLQSTAQLRITITGANDAPDSIWSETGLAINSGVTNNQYIEFANVGNLFSRDDFTLRFSFTTTQDSPYFLSYAQGTEHNELRVSCYDGALKVFFKGSQWITSIDSDLLTDGRRHELAIVRTSVDGGLRVYLDGVLGDSRDGFKPGQRLLSDGTVILGQEQDYEGGAFDSSQIFKGTYWDMAVHATAWPQDKINLSIGHTLDSEPDLLGHWDFDLLAGNALLDSEGGRHGTLKGIAPGGPWKDGDAILERADWNAGLLENSPAGTVVARLQSSDPDANDSLTWSLLNDSGGRFSIDSQTGVITVTSAASLNFEQQQTHQIVVKATDLGGLSRQETYTIQLVDVQETGVSTPVDLDSASNRVAEDSPTGSAIPLQVWAVDEDGTTNRVSYRLLDDAGGRFAIDAVTGQVSVADSSLLDREQNSSHVITVRAESEDGTTADQTFTIEVEDVDEFDIGSISDLNLAANRVLENLAGGSSTGVILNASDADATLNEVTWSLLNDDGGRFTIDPNTGEVRTTRSFNYEDEGGQREIVVQARSADGSTSDALIQIEIVDVVENPTANPDSFTVLEGGAFQSPAGWLAENDQFIDQTGYTYSLVVAPTWGTAAIAADGTLHYQHHVPDVPANQLPLTDSLTYQVRGANGGFAEATVAISITPLPVSVADSGYTADSGFSVTITAAELLSNDVGNNHQLRGIQIVSQPAVGTLTITADQRIIYEAPPTFSGEVTFEYAAAAEDQILGRPASVTIVVEPVVLPPAPPAAPPSISSSSSSSASSSSGGDSSNNSSSGETVNEPKQNPTAETAKGGTGEASSGGGEAGIPAVGPMPTSGAAPGSGFTDGAGDESSSDTERSEAAGGANSGKDRDSSGGSASEQADSEASLSLAQTGSSSAIQIGRDVATATRVFASAASIQQQLTASVQFSEYLSKLESQLEETPLVIGFQMPTYAAAGASLFTVGYVAWLIRGGVLLTSFMSSLPSWQSFDPLPILENAGSGDDDLDTAGDDTSIAELVDSPNPGPPSLVSTG